MVFEAPAPAESRPLACVERDPPEPGPGELRVRVEVCGVCRTDLHVVEGDLAPRRARIVPGHEVVGRVDACGPGAQRFRPGDRVGIAWLHRACGACRFCERGDENLCLAPRFTGWDVDGGYADFALAAEDFAYALPDALAPRAAAPLLCAGIIGYRAYLRARVKPGQRLGLFGFGGSAHIVIQIARHHGCRVFVFSRGERHQEHARSLGASWRRPVAPPSTCLLLLPVVQTGGRRRSRLLPLTRLIRGSSNPVKTANRSSGHRPKRRCKHAVSVCRHPGRGNRGQNPRSANAPRREGRTGR